MKNIVIILFFVFSTFSMGLKIDDVDFDQEMVLGEKATKEFFLENKKMKYLDINWVLKKEKRVFL